MLVGQTRFRWHPIYWLLALYLAVMLLSGLLSAEPRTSAVKLVTQVYLLSLPVLTYNLIETLADLKRVLRWWLYGAALVALVGVATLLLWAVDRGNPITDEMLHGFGTLPPGDYPRVELTFKFPAMLCNYLIASLAILLAFHHQRWMAKRWCGLLFVGICVSAFFSLTPGLGGLPLLLGTWYWLVERRRRPRRARTGQAAGIGGAFLFLVAASVTPILHRTAPFLIHVPWSGITLAPAARTMFWMEAWANFIERPLVGSGIGTDAISVRYEYVDGKVDTLTDAHNVFLNIAATCGILGLAALLALLAYIWRRTLPLRIEADGANVVRLALGLGFLVCFAYQGLTGSYEDARHLWVLLGLFLVSGRLEGEGSRA